MRFNYFFFVFLVIFYSSCGDESVTPETIDPIEPNSWLVPQDQVFDGGPGKDGIPSVDAPSFSAFDDIPVQLHDQLVLGIVHDGIIRAYPHTILDWHEIVNDDIGDLSVAVTYCPLTGTGIGWNRIVNGTKTSFGVSGLLFDSNLMPYDRATNSTWSQQRLDCVNGTLVGDKSDNITLIETNLLTWIEAYPESEIMNTSTGFNRAYGSYPYGDYRTNNSRKIFPVSNEDERLPSKERVLGVIINNESMGFPFSEDSQETEVIKSELGGQNIAVTRNTAKNFITAYMNPDDLDLQPIRDQLPAVMRDQDGNTYDISGIVIDGPKVGTRLVQPTSFIGYWFSWGTFYPDIKLFGE